MGSACRTAPTPRKYPSLQRCQLRSFSSALSLFSGLVVDPNISSCHVDLNISSCHQYLSLSTASSHVESYLHIDIVLSCRPHTVMSTSYCHVDLILSCRPHTFMSTSYFQVDLNISSCRHRLPSLTFMSTSYCHVDLILSCRPQHLLLSTSASISYCQPQSLVISESISFVSNTSSSTSSKSALYIVPH